MDRTYRSDHPEEPESVRRPPGRFRVREPGEEERWWRARGEERDWVQGGFGYRDQSGFEPAPEDVRPRRRAGPDWVGRRWTPSPRAEPGPGPLYPEAWRPESFTEPGRASWTQGYGDAGALGEQLWETAGPFSGRGPRGYRRPDEWIRSDVCEALARHGGIDATDFEVHVKQGEVTLDGQVPDRRTKRLAEDLGWRAAGVHDVHNRLRIARLELETETSPDDHNGRRVEAPGGGPG